MKTFKLLGATALVLFFMTSCTTSFELNNVDTPENEIYTDRGTLIQSIEKEDITVSMKGNPVINSNEASIIAGIQNNSKTPYEFDDSQISIYGGNTETDSWNYIKTWDANKYFNDAKSKANAKRIASVISGILNIASASNESKSTTTISDSNGNSTTITTRTYNPSNVAITGLIESEKIARGSNETEQTIDFLSNNLLFDSRVNENKDYAGILYFPVENKYPDYKVQFNKYNEKLNFYFARSDRAEILNPWLDKSHPRHSIVASRAISDDKMDLTYYFSNNKWFGFYSGISMYNILFNTNFGTSNATNDIYQAIGAPLGLTIKTLPYTWLTLGFDFGYRFNKYSQGTSNNTPIYDPFIAPQVGLNFIINHINLNARATYTMDKHLYVDLGLGYAFN